MQSKLRLSEAILLGSTMVTPKRGIVLTRSNPFDEDLGCALGMAFKAAGFVNTNGWRVPRYSTMYATLHQSAVVPCQCRLPYTLPVRDIVTHIFDSHVIIEGDYVPILPAWTLEMLVDWVRSQESQPQVESTVTEEAKETVCSV